MGDYYSVLEVGREASTDEIKTNYRRLAMKWHPDRNGGSAEAEERFKSISEAYAVLSDPERRRSYDQGGMDPASAQTQSTPYGQGFGFNPFGFRTRPFTAEEAAAMFMQEMQMLAAELTMQNVGWQDIAAELERRGCPAEVAATIAQDIEKKRKALMRSRARGAFVSAAVSGVIGLGLFASFAGVGLGILGFLGLLMSISGAFNLVRALYYMTTGRAPS